MGSTSRNVENSEPSAPESSPPAVFPHHSDHSFVLQTIVELQKTVGQLVVEIRHNTESINGLKSKTEDLVNWKNRILGGAIVLGAIIALLAFLVSKFSEYVTVAAPVKTTISAPSK